MVEQLLKAHYQRALTIAKRALPSAEDAEDVVQDAQLLVYQKFHMYDPSRPFANWYSRVLRNTIITFRRNQGRVKATEAGLYESPQPFPEAEIAERIDLEKLLSLLPEAHREILRKLYVEQKFLSEIAVEMGCPQTTVRYRAHNACKYLRECARVYE